MLRAPAILLLACLAVPLSAQEPDPWRVGLPAETARSIDMLLNDSTTVRFQGAARIAAGDRIGGSVIAWSGTLTIAGTVGGQVVVLHGNLVLEPGASIGGDVTVVDGAVSGLNTATVAGGVMEYREGFGRDARRRYADPDEEHARSDIAIGIEGNYNRVEGMPIHFGPDLRTGGPASLRLQALAILRTEPGFFDTKAMGYRASLSQRIPRTGGLSLEASAFSRLEPVESWYVSDLEATLGALLLHDDLRDYYERIGWSAGLRFANGPFEARAEFAREEHASALQRDPWTLFRGDRAWRLMPLAAEGDIDLLRATATVDMRRSERFAGTGWFARSRIVHGVSGSLAVAARNEPGFATQPDLPSMPFDADFTVALVDLRAYQDFADGVFGLRVLAAGSLERAALPPQYQFSLGGIGSLPGYAQFHADCGARTRFVTVPDPGAASGSVRPGFDRYGCDRVAMVQAEYRGGFGLRVGDRDPVRKRDHFGMSFEPDWVLFFDAGRGWSYGDNAATTGNLFDAGAGLLIGDIGVYAAVPLTGEQRDMRIFLRLGPRF
jgi:hypothetical protein